MAAIIFLLFGFQFFAALFFVLFISFSKGVSMFPAWELGGAMVVCLCAYLYAQRQYGVSKETKKTLIKTLCFNLFFILHLGATATFMDAYYVASTTESANSFADLWSAIPSMINLIPVVSTLFFIARLIPNGEINDECEKAENDS
jgi:hypothetical protein